MDEADGELPMSDEMEANFNEDIDAMERLVQIIGDGLGASQTLNDLARADEEALINDIFLPHLRLYDSVDGDFARDTVRDTIEELIEQLEEDGPETAVLTVKKTVAGWDEALADELGISLDL